MPIIPTYVLERHLQGFNEDERTQIREAARQAETYVLQQAKKSETPLFLMTAGSAGSGKSMHLKQQVAILETDGSTVVLLDPTSILEWMAPYKNLQMHIAESEANETMQREMDEAAKRWRHAGKFVADHLLNVSAENGISAAYETTGRTPFVRSLMSKAREAGMRVRVDICDAPYQTKLQSCADRFRTEAERMNNEREIWNTDTDISGNLRILAEEADEMRIYWRSYRESPTKIIARSTGTQSTIHDQGLADAFSMFHRTRNKGGLADLLSVHAESVAHRAKKIQPAMA